MAHPRPLSTLGVRRRTLPFLGALAVAFAVAPLPAVERDGSALLAAGVLAVAVVAAVGLTPWHRLPAWMQALPPLAVFPVIALLRDADGGTTSGYGVLVILPVFWFAMYGTRRELCIAIAAMAATLIAPLLLAGNPLYPSTEWRRVLLWAVAAPLIGFTVQNLIARVRGKTEELESAARTDTLTGLPNRRALDEEIPDELERAARYGYPLSLAMIDLDHFKRLNDERGHQAGDRLLKRAAAAWRSELRHSDIVVRYAGDEFLVALPNCTPANAHALIDRLVRALPPGQTCSAGVAHLRSGESVDQLVARADAALLAAKRGGRAQVVSG
ncbi:MAG TPA: GGDEF domain-containing protein [Thermoleophilaceae bacterium]